MALDLKLLESKKDSSGLSAEPEKKSRRCFFTLKVWFHLGNDDGGLDDGTSQSLT